MKETTQTVESRLMQNIEIHGMWQSNPQTMDEDEEVQEEEEEEEDSNNNEEVSHEVKLQKEKTLSENEFNEKMRKINDKSALLKNLQDQLIKIKAEMFQQNETTTTSQSTTGSSTNKQQLNPFKQDPGKYLEKILSLVNIINEVFSHTNLLELKNEYEKTKYMLMKIRSKRDKFFNELS